MKTLRLIPALLLVVIVFSIISCGNQGKKQKQTEDSASTAKIEVSVSGMTCTGCEQTIQNNVMKIEGVSFVKADLKAGRAVVDYNPAVADTSDIRKAITGSGYKVNSFNPAIEATPSN